VGLGTAVGSFLGPFFSEHFTYLPTFLIAASAFFFAFLILKFYAIKK
jgi:predicted MFS family arabinose efflux permease